MDSHTYVILAIILNVIYPNWSIYIAVCAHFNMPSSGEKLIKGNIQVEILNM